MIHILTVLQIITAALIGIDGMDEYEDVIICEVMPAEVYGMDDSDGAKVCANIIDYTDFTIIYEHDNGTIVLAGFNEHGEVIHEDVLLDR